MDKIKNYFSIQKLDNIHIISDRIPLNWREIITLPVASFFILFFIIGWLGALVIGILSVVFYVLFRFAAWFYYSETHLNTKTGEIIRLKIFLGKTTREEIIDKNLKSDNFSFVEVHRSGKTKYLLRYSTHKNNDLLILKNLEDKITVQNYITEELVN